MEEVYDEPTGPRLYILTQNDYDELRDIQTMLVLMAQVSPSDEDIEKDHTGRTSNRSDINRFFADISAQIGTALDGIRKDNGMGPPSEEE